MKNLMNMPTSSKRKNPKKSITKSTSTKRISRKSLKKPKPSIRKKKSKIRRLGMKRRRGKASQKRRKKKQRGSNQTRKS